MNFINVLLKQAERSARERLLKGEPLTSYAWSSLPAYEKGRGPKWLVMDILLVLARR